MPHILTGISSLIQYKNDVEGSLSEVYRPERCDSCGKLTPWRHGCYDRKTAGSKNNTDASHNPIIIQRYYCSSCGKTMSVLPECIPRNRWYLWSVQEIILLLFVSGLSIHKIAKAQRTVSRHTISRWISRFKSNFLIHRDILMHSKSVLSFCVTFNSFWSACLNLLSLGEAMRICHTSGVIVP